MGPEQKSRFLATLGQIAQPPPDIGEYRKRILRFLLLLCRLPPDPLMDVRFRLFSDYELDYSGRDVFQLLSGQRYEFFEITGESPETFLQFVTYSKN